MKRHLFSALFSLLLLSIHSQTSIYLEAFEGSSLNIPAGWVSTPSVSAWALSSSNSSTTYVGASGGNNVKIDNTVSPTGSYSIMTCTVSTTGYSGITVSWGARFTTNFPPSNISPQLYYSTNGGTSWSAVSYTEASSGSVWKLNGPVNLPSSADNQSSLRFRLVANITSAANGTYRIDDFQVKGTSLPTSLNKNTLSGKLTYYVYDNVLNFKSENELVNIHSIKFFEITGKKIFTKSLQASPAGSIALPDFTSGVYLVTFELDNGQTLTKKIILF